MTEPPLSGAGRVQRWWVSWPAIIVGLVVCLFPGLVLLWLRPTTSARVKGLVTAASVAAVMMLGAVSEPADRGTDGQWLPQDRSLPPLPERLAEPVAG